MKLDTYMLPAFWAPALINGDITGMEPHEVRAMDRWFADVLPVNSCCIDCSDDDSTNFMRWHDAASYVKACDVLEFTFNLGDSAR